MSKEKKIAKLNTDYAKEQYVEFQKQQRQLIFRRRRIAVILLAALAIFAGVGFQLFNDYQNLQSLQTLKTETEDKAAAAETKVADLQETVALLNDKDYVAKIARRDYYYSKDGEEIYVYTPKKDAADTADSGTAATDPEAVDGNE